MKTLLLSICLLLISSAGYSKGGWSIDKSFTNIPDNPAIGSIFGKNFELGKAELNGHALTISSKKMGKFWPEGKLIIFVKLEGEEGEWNITPNSTGQIPHVHMNFTKEGQNNSGILMFVGEYSMNLKLVKDKSGKVKGKIHISLPDYKHTFLLGSFIVE